MHQMSKSKSCSELLLDTFREMNLIWIHFRRYLHCHQPPPHGVLHFLTPSTSSSHRIALLLPSFSHWT
jgi:hypothetical protein